MNNFMTMLKIKSQTWYKDSHSLFDYESTKVSESSVSIPMPLDQVIVFRKKSSKVFNISDSEIGIYNRFQYVDPEMYDFLTFFRVRPINKSGFFTLEFTDDDYKKTSKKH